MRPGPAGPGGPRGPITTPSAWPDRAWASDNQRRCTGGPLATCAADGDAGTSELHRHESDGGHLTPGTGPGSPPTAAPGPATADGPWPNPSSGTTAFRRPPAHACPSRC